MSSEDGRYTLQLAYNGSINVGDTQTRKLIYSLNQFMRAIKGPFFLRLEVNGVLNAIDASG